MEQEQRSRKRKGIQATVRQILKITAGSMIYATGVSLFLDPNQLAPGGVTGISVILSRVSPVATGTWILLLNIPILLLGVWKFGFRFLCSTLYSLAVISAAANLLGHFPPLTEDPLLASLAGSVLMAVGIGMVFKADATTGGTDIVVRLLRRHFPYIKTGGLYLAMDSVIVAASALVFQNVDRALYAGLTIVLTALLLDVVLYGRDEAKMLFIISDKASEIAGRLLKELNVGATYLEGNGAFTSEEKQVILCVVKKQLAPGVEDIVKTQDPRSFMIVSSAQEIYGEGYKSLFGSKY